MWKISLIARVHLLFLPWVNQFAGAVICYFNLTYFFLDNLIFDFHLYCRWLWYCCLLLDHRRLFIYCYFIPRRSWNCICNYDIEISSGDKSCVGVCLEHLYNVVCLAITESSYLCRTGYFQRDVDLSDTFVNVVRKDVWNSWAVVLLNGEGWVITIGNCWLN